MDNPWTRRIAVLEAEVKDLEERLKATHTEAERHTASLEAELVPQMREVVHFATERGHTWPGYRPPFFGPSEPDEEGLVAYLVEMFGAEQTHKYSREVKEIERELREKRRALKKPRQFVNSWSSS